MERSKMSAKIQSETEYNAALKRADEIFAAKPGTPEGYELERLVEWIEVYEEKHYPMDPLDPEIRHEVSYGARGGDVNQSLIV